jgi:hypothetical protein
MVAAGQRRLADRGVVVQGDLNTFMPSEPVAAVTCFRAVYYASDQQRFFVQVAGMVPRKFVFDVNPRQYSVGTVIDRLRLAGFDTVVTRPFLVPQTRKVPGLVRWLLVQLEQVPLLAHVLLRWRFTYILAAYRRAAES